VIFWGNNLILVRWVLPLSGRIQVHVLAFRKLISLEFHFFPPLFVMQLKSQFSCEMGLLVWGIHLLREREANLNSPL
jgi:hypothetical protein